MPTKVEPKTLGQYLVHKSLPDGYSFDNLVVDKGTLSAGLSAVGRNSPEQFAATATKLRNVGNLVATHEGLSVGLDDIRPEYKKRDPIIRNSLRRIKAAQSDKEKQKILKDTQDEILAITKTHPGTMSKQALSGGRGSFAQLMRTVSSPVAAQAADGSTEPWLIRHSFAEGLSGSEFWAANAEARIKGSESFSLVTEPGEMHKHVSNTMGEQVISTPDCGTKNGIDEPTAGRYITNRYLATKHGPYPANTLVTPKVADALKRTHSTLLVRSPMTCEAPNGVCQKCYGNTFRGEVPDIGINVGMIGAHAIAEPLQQGAMSAKHAQGVLGGDNLGLHGFKGFQTFLEIPKKFPNAATLAELDGEVTSVEKAPQGGHFVYVGSEKHFVHPHLKVTTKQGQKVEAGDTLSTGVPKPNEVVKYKGIGEGRKYYVDSMHTLFDRDFTKGIDKRHFEVLARSQLSNAEVVGDPQGGLLRGDLVDYNTIHNRLKQDVKTTSISKATGEVLAESQAGFMAGTKITPKIAEKLKLKGVKDVAVAVNPPEFEFVMRPLSFTPLMNPDWMARLSQSHLKDSIMRAAIEGQSSNIHGYNPFPAIAVGKELKYGPGGTY